MMKVHVSDCEDMSAALRELMGLSTEDDAAGTRVFAVQAPDGSELVKATDRARGTGLATIYATPIADHGLRAVVVDAVDGGLHLRVTDFWAPADGGPMRLIGAGEDAKATLKVARYDLRNATLPLGLDKDARVGIERAAALIEARCQQIGARRRSGLPLAA